MSLGEYLEELRGRLKLSQLHMALVLGVSRQQYIRYIKHNIVPKKYIQERMQERLLKIERALEGGFSVPSALDYNGRYKRVTELL